MVGVDAGPCREATAIPYPHRKQLTPDFSPYHAPAEAIAGLGGTCTTTRPLKSNDQYFSVFQKLLTGAFRIQSAPERGLRPFRCRLR